MQQDYLTIHLNFKLQFQKVSMSSQWLCGVFVVLALSCGAYGQGLTEEEQEEILKAHNYYRGLVDPIATNMLKMVS